MPSTTSASRWDCRHSEPLWENHNSLQHNHKNHNTHVFNHMPKLSKPTEKGSRQRKPQTQPIASGMTDKSLIKRMDTLLSRIPKGTAAMLGGALGGPQGAAIGGAIAKITGYGDYLVQQNSISTKGVSGVEGTDIVPSFSTTGVNTRVTHREFVGNITSPGAGFTNVSYPINASNPAVFPWLSALARKYQRYKVHGMVFYYKSTSTDYNNSGTVAACVNYDAAEVAYKSMGEILNAKFAVSCKPSLHMSVPVECDPREQPTQGYYIEHGDTTSRDARFTSMGKLNLATEGLTLPAGTVIGQLWVAFDIELMYPCISVAEADASVNRSTALTTTANLSTAVSAFRIGSTQVAYRNDPVVDTILLGVAPYSDTAPYRPRFVFRLPGKYFLEYTQVANSGYVGTALSGTDEFNGVSVSWVLTTGNIATTTYSVQYIVNVLQPDSSFSPAWGSITAGSMTPVCSLVRLA